MDVDELRFNSNRSSLSNEGGLVIAVFRDGDTVSEVQIPRKIFLAFAELIKDTKFTD